MGLRAALAQDAFGPRAHVLPSVGGPLPLVDTPGGLTSAAFCSLLPSPECAGFIRRVDEREYYHAVLVSDREHAIIAAHNREVARINRLQTPENYRLEYEMTEYTPMQNRLFAYADAQVKGRIARENDEEELAARASRVAAHLKAHPIAPPVVAPPLARVQAVTAASPAVPHARATGALQRLRPPARPAASLPVSPSSSIAALLQMSSIAHSGPPSAAASSSPLAAVALVHMRQRRTPKMKTVSFRASLDLEAPTEQKGFADPTLLFLTPSHPHFRMIITNRTEDSMEMDESDTANPEDPCPAKWSRQWVAHARAEMLARAQLEMKSDPMVTGAMREAVVHSLKRAVVSRRLRAEAEQQHRDRTKEDQKDPLTEQKAGTKRAYSDVAVDNEATDSDSDRNI
jgi:hypothetical protein